MSAPVFSADSVELGPRPHTQAVTDAAMMEITADDLRVMSEEELRNVCGAVGIATKPSWTRTRLLSEIVKTSREVENY